MGQLLELQNHAKLIHIFVELFSKKITGQKKKKKDEGMLMMNYFWEFSYKTRILKPHGANHEL